MSDLGALLRKAREQRGYTLDDIQEYTKIRKRYLEAIETGEYKVLPGSFYVRAFVKTYAETVGLDAEEVLRLYQKELPKPPTVETQAAEPRIKPRRRSVQHNDRWGKIAVSLLMWAFPILIAAVIYIYYANNKDATEPEPSNSNPPITTETGSLSPSPSITPPPSVSETPSTEPVSLTLTNTLKSIKYYDVSPGTGHKIQIVVDGRCWVEIRKNGTNGEKVYFANAEAGTLTFELSGPLYVNVGRSDLASISIDDVPVEDSNKSSSSKFLFTPKTAEAQ